MRELMRRVTDDFGSLAAVRGTKVAATAGEAPEKFEEITLEFANGSLAILAVGLDDSIEIRETGSRPNNGTDLTDTPEWRGLLGATVAWTWTMKNQQGFLDGFQLEFSRPGQQWDVQFMVEASSLSVRRF